MIENTIPKFEEYMNENKTPKPKYKIGDKLEIIADVIMKGLVGTVIYRDYDFEDKQWQYFLDVIHNPKIKDKNGDDFKVNKSIFYESWLKKIK